MRCIVIFLQFIVAFPGWSQEAFSVSSQGVDIYYYVYGSGAPVLIVNGGPGFNSNGFQSIAEEIADLGYTAILYDQRGTGLSTMDKVNELTITMDLMVADMEAIRKDLGYEHWVIFGHSFGGMMANYYTSIHPHRVLAMILSSSGGIDLALLGQAQQQFNMFFSQAELDSLTRWRDIRNQDSSGEIVEKYNYLFAKAYVYNDVYRPVVAKRLGEADHTINRLVWQNLRHIGYDCKESLAHFHRPVLILHGAHDIVSKEVALDAHNVYPHSKLVVLEHCGHYGWLDRREAYFQEIESFLAALN